MLKLPPISDPLHKSIPFTCRIMFQSLSTTLLQSIRQPQAFWRGYRTLYLQRHNLSAAMRQAF